MTDAFSRVITSLFDLLVKPFGDDRSLALIGLSLACGVVMIYLFKATSNQDAIRRTRDQFKARILEMRLYQDDVVLIFKALGAALWTNVSYLRVSLKPILVLVLFVIVVFIQLDERYGRGPFQPGDQTVLTVTLKDGADVNVVPMSVMPGPGIVVDSQPVRAADRREINWRLRVASEGIHEVQVSAYDKPYSFPVTAEISNLGIGHMRTANSTVQSLIHPTLPPLRKDSPIQSLKLGYPGSSYSLFGWRTHWLVIFIICSFVGALIPKFVFGIEV